MAIDYTKMEQFLLAYAEKEWPDEEEDILKSIEKLKTMTDEDVWKIDTFIYNRVLKPIYDSDFCDDTCFDEFAVVVHNYFYEAMEQRLKTFLEEHPEIEFDTLDTEAKEGFLNAHPEFDPESDEYLEARDDFLYCKILEKENEALKIELADEAYNNLDGNTIDELRRNATDDAAKEFGLHPAVIQYLELPNALPSGF